MHLMVSPVDALAADFADAGADLISFHPDASTHAPQHPGDQGARRQGRPGVQPGRAARRARLGDRRHRPDPDHERQPGLRRPGFIDSALRKIEAARKRIEACGKGHPARVDGGIKAANIRGVADAGADTFVAGSAIFGQTDYKAVIDHMRAALA